MTGRAALVTGSSSGIGLAIARALGRDGYSVTLSARRVERLEAAADALRAEGVEVHSLPADVGREEDVVGLARAHAGRFGRLDVLVNNAGVGAGGEIADHPTAKLDLQLGVNLRAAYLLLRECVPLLRAAGAEHGKALVVNVASIAGKVGAPGLAAYSASKAGLVALSKAAQGELGAAGVQVTALCPGFVDTPMTKWVEGVPREEMIRPEDVAEAVSFLLRTSPPCLVPEIVLARRGARS